MTLAKMDDKKSTRTAETAFCTQFKGFSAHTCTPFLQNCGLDFIVVNHKWEADMLHLVVNWPETLNNSARMLYMSFQNQLLICKSVMVPIVHDGFHEAVYGGT